MVIAAIEKHELFALQIILWRDFLLNGLTQRNTGHACRKLKTPLSAMLLSDAQWVSYNDRNETYIVKEEDIRSLWREGVSLKYLRDRK
jgi:hypothetical protein